MTTTKPRRRWFQFRLRTLLVLMLLSCLVIGWLSGKQTTFWQWDLKR